METCKCPHEKHDCAILPKTNFQMVKEFHKKFRQPIGAGPRIIARHRQSLRIGLMGEELDEVVRAMAEATHLDQIAKELADLLYVVYGTAVEYGIDVDAVFAEVHRSNMSKLDADGKPIYREDGKVLKSSQYEPPNIARVLGLTNS